MAATVPYFVVNAFTVDGQPPARGARALFSGNPAGVCPLKEPLPTDVMQALAAQNNLSETAFFTRRARGEYDLRWFTPKAEVDLCGHATLAAAFTLFHFLEPSLQDVRFQTLSGELTVVRGDGIDSLDLPLRPAAAASPPEALLEGLGTAPRWVGRSRDYLVELESEDDVRCLEPDFAALSRLDSLGVLVTAPGRDCDFVSRCFYPRVGILEDPATGSAHCTLAPFWAERLGKRTLSARQLSSRGAWLGCELRDDRLLVGGRCRLYLRGEVELPEPERPR